MTTAALMSVAALYRSWARPPELLYLPAPAPTARGTAAPEDTKEPAEPGRCYTFLVVGRDGTGGNTDTILFVSYDVTRDCMNVMSIPRDLMVNVPWDLKRINAVYAAEGIDGLKARIGSLLGYAPDFYVTVDLKGFIALVDAVGGVEMEIPLHMYYDDPTQNLRIRVPKGLQKLDGERALQAVRFRINNDGTGYVMGDMERMAFQQKFLAALAKQCLKLENLTKIGELARIFSEHVETDLEPGNLLWLGEQMLRLKADEGIHFYSLPGDYAAMAYSRTYQSMQSYVTPDPEALAALVNETLHPYRAPVAVEDLELMYVDADGNPRLRETKQRKGE